MKLREYLKALNTLVKDNPEALDMVVVTSSDDEGNSFHLVNFEPCIGLFDERNREFEQLDFSDGANAVCLN
jgi:pyruvate dehydrogenase complex dehydrogenase (E1) component